MRSARLIRRPSAAPAAAGPPGRPDMLQEPLAEGRDLARPAPILRIDQPVAALVADIGLERLGQAPRCDVGREHHRRADADGPVGHRRGQLQVWVSAAMRGTAGAALLGPSTPAPARQGGPFRVRPHARDLEHVSAGPAARPARPWPAARPAPSGRMGTGRPTRAPATLPCGRCGCRCQPHRGAGRPSGTRNPAARRCAGGSPGRFPAGAPAEPEPSGLHASSADTLTLSDGAVLLAYGDVSKRFNPGRPTVATVIREPLGRWDKDPLHLVIDTGQDTWDQSNPAVVELPDDRFLIISYDIFTREIIGEPPASPHLIPLRPKNWRDVPPFFGREQSREGTRRGGRHGWACISAGRAGNCGAGGGGGRHAGGVDRVAVRRRVDGDFRRRLACCLQLADRPGRSGAGTPISPAGGGIPDLMRELGPALGSLYDETPTVVLGPVSRGALVGALTAAALGVGFVEVRKESAQASDSDRWVKRTTGPDYRDRHVVFGFRRDLVRSGDRVLMVDDWADTGATARVVRDLGGRLRRALDRRRLHRRRTHRPPLPPRPPPPRPPRRPALCTPVRPRSEGRPRALDAGTAGRRAAARGSGAGGERRRGEAGRAGRVGRRRCWRTRERRRR